MSCLAMGIACCGMWELWKSRNTMIFEGKTRDWHRSLRAWVPKIASLIPKRGDVPCLRHLGVVSTPQSLRGHWDRWHPGPGRFTLNVAIVNRSGSWWGGLVARHKEGTWSFGGAFRVPDGVGHALLWLIDKALGCSAGTARSWSVQSSHPAIRDLSHSNWEDAPVEVIYLSRRMIQSYGVITFHKICASTNGVALLLAYLASSEGLIPHSEAPVASRVAFNGDLACLPQFCSGSCDVTRRLLPVQSHDDGGVHTTRDRPAFQDDTFIFPS
ncbi:hypothetical protein QQ045_001692 [Rhodiola kirilowii]